jgi:hypothetical protein
MSPFRDLASRVAEMVGPMPYPALNAAFDGLFPKGMRSYWKGSYVTELTDADSAAINVLLLGFCQELAVRRAAARCLERKKAEEDGDANPDDATGWIRD